MAENSRRFLVGFLAILWLTVVIAIYYVWHKPLSTSTAVQIGAALGRLMLALGMISLAGALGRKVTGGEVGGSAGMAVQAAFGCGVVSLIILIAGAVIGLNAWVAWIMVLLLGVVLWRDAILWWQPVWELRSLWSMGGSSGKWIAVGLCIIGLTTLTTALAPPLKFDALVYHLSIPQTYLLNGGITYLNWSMFWGMPQTGEMLYSWAIALGGLPAASVLGWACGLVSIYGLLGYLSEKFGTKPGWVGTAALTAGFTITASLAWAYIDWMLVLFGMSALILLDHWASSGRRRSLVLAGAFAGMALGTKYTGGIAIITGLAVVMWEHQRVRKSMSELYSSLFIYIAPAILLSLPWWIKNYLATGNAFYPFFFPAGAVDAFRLNFYQIGIWGDWKDVILLPIMSSLTGVEGTPGYSASIGPLLLGLGVCILIPYAKLETQERNTLRIATIFCVMTILVWVVAARLSGYLIQSRLYAASFPAFAVLAAAGYKRISQIHFSQVRLGRLAVSLVLVVFTLTTFELVRHTLEQGSPQLILGTITSDEYLEGNLGWYARAVKAMNDLPPDSHVLMLWEPRNLFCLPNCVPDEVIDRWKHAIVQYGTAGGILSQWKMDGYTHLLLNRAGAEFVRNTDDRYTDTDWETLDELLDSLPSAGEDFGQAYTLFPLKP